MKKAAIAPPKRLGRPLLPPDNVKRRRDIRLEDDLWEWCKQKGGDNASRYIRELIEADRREER